MRKTLYSMIVLAFAAMALNAQAASHAGGAPMKAASEPAAKASAPAKKKVMKTDKKKIEEKK